MSWRVAETKSVQKLDLAVAEGMAVWDATKEYTNAFVVLAV